MAGVKWLPGGRVDPVRAPLPSFLSDQVANKAKAKKAEHFHFDFNPLLGPDGHRVVDELRQWHILGAEPRGEQLAKAIARFVKEALLAFRKPTMTQAAG